MADAERYRLRDFTPADIPAGLRLTQAQAWSHRLEDWQFHHAMGRGFCVVDERDAVVGTTLWWSYGPRFGSLGLVVVDNSLQGRGIGRRLMEAVFADAGERCLQLCATTAGLKLYQQCGFVTVDGIRQCQAEPHGAAPVEPPAGVRIEADGFRRFDALCRCDSLVFGGDRRRVLAGIAGPQNTVVALRGDELVGYALARPSGRGTVIGPIVAPDARTAIALISAHLPRIRGIVRVDIPAHEAELHAWLEHIGVRCIDEVTRMQRGTPPTIAKSARIFGLVSQAMG